MNIVNKEKGSSYWKKADLIVRVTLKEYDQQWLSFLAWVTPPNFGVQSVLLLEDGLIWILLVYLLLTNILNH